LFGSPGGSVSFTNVSAVLSMLHEAPAEHPGLNSATRLFRANPVLHWTLERMSRSSRIGSSAILCWEDQLPGVVPVAEEHRVCVLAKGPRIALPEVESIAAARHWADGWRGGLLSTCHFDLGFYGPWHREVAQRLGSDAVLLIDPASGLVDPVLLDRLIEHAEERTEVELCFCAAAPGLGGALLRRGLLDRLAAARAHPGRLLHYLPDQLSREPLAGGGCLPVPTPVARTTQTFSLHSRRQIERIEAATVSLNGELVSSDAEAIVRRVQSTAGIDPLPRELVLELNTERKTRPIFWPGRKGGIERGPVNAACVAALLEELGGADDTRLTLGGVGDPMLSEHVFDVIDAAAAHGIVSIHVETDLLSVTKEQVARLARGPIEVLSVQLPAVTPQTYAQVMGVDGHAALLENLRRFVAERQAAGRRLPILVPVFVKCAANLAEMEAWYDQWLRAVGSALIVGPSDYGGGIPDVAVADMSPPRRVACGRINSRVTVLCDGRVVSCEQDVHGRQEMGRIGQRPLREIWQQAFAALRSDHGQGQWKTQPVCAGCREWHRP
jgi:radical SAM protein with 4Fe4S-binding SPASM domain